MIVTFRKIKESLHTFRAQDKELVYQGSIKSEPSGRGTTLFSVNSYPDLGNKEPEVVSKYVKFKKGNN